MNHLDRMLPNFVASGFSHHDRRWCSEPRSTAVGQCERPSCSLKGTEKKQQGGNGWSGNDQHPHHIKVILSEEKDATWRHLSKAREKGLRWWSMADDLSFSSSCRRRRRVFVVVFFLIFIYSAQTQMSTTMDQVVKKAKDSFGPIFDKSLHDLVRGIRNHKENEVRISSFSDPKETERMFHSSRNTSMKRSTKSNRNWNRTTCLSKPMLWTN